jgi:hypothetical protein
MPTTIYDSSLITQRRRDKTISGSFINRIQNPSNPTTGSAPYLGITEQSIINTVKNGQMSQYRKDDGGCTSVSTGCPCIFPPNIPIINGWATRIAGLAASQNYSTIVDSNNNAIISGVYDGATTIYNSDGTIFGTLPFTGVVDGFVVKYDSNGFAIWATRIAGSGFDGGISINVDSNDNIVITGQYTASTTIYNSDGSIFGTLVFTGGAADCCVIKYNPNGFGIWATRIAGTALDTGNGITVDSGNNIIITGQFQSSAIIYNKDGSTFSTLTSVGAANCFVVKFNPDGFGVWQTKIGGTGIEAGIAINVDSNNSIVVVGRYSSNPVTIYNSDGLTFGTLLFSGVRDCFIVKYNPNGFGIWATRIAGTGQDFPLGITIDSGNNIIVSGYYTALTTIFNANGSSFGTLTLNGIRNCFVVKYNPNGSGIWATRIAGTSLSSFVNGNGITVDSGNNIIVTGYYQDPVSVFNADGSVFETLAFSGTIPNGDCFVVKYASNGFGVWATRIASTGEEFGSSVSVDANNSIVVSGSYDSNPLIIYNANGSIAGTLALSGDANCFVVKYKSNGFIN